jgi:hypothetical protein
MNNLYASSPTKQGFAEQRIREHFVRKGLDAHGVEYADVW